MRLLTFYSISMCLVHEYILNVKLEVWILLKNLNLLYPFIERSYLANKIDGIDFTRNSNFDVPVVNLWNGFIFNLDNI